MNHEGCTHLDNLAAQNACDAATVQAETAELADQMDRRNNRRESSSASVLGHLLSGHGQVHTRPMTGEERSQAQAENADQIAAQIAAKDRLAPPPTPDVVAQRLRAARGNAAKLAILYPDGVPELF